MLPIGKMLDQSYYCLSKGKCQGSRDSMTVAKNASSGRTKNALSPNKQQQSSKVSSHLTFTLAQQYGNNNLINQPLSHTFSNKHRLKLEYSTSTQLKMMPGFTRITAHITPTHCLFLPPGGTAVNIRELRCSVEWRNVLEYSDKNASPVVQSSTQSIIECSPLPHVNYRG